MRAIQSTPPGWLEGFAGAPQEGSPRDVHCAGHFPGSITPSS